MSEKIFCDCRFYILPNGILQKRIQLFEKQILKYGGELVLDFRESLPTHILIEDDLLSNPARLKNALKSTGILNRSLECEIVGIKWLCCCLKKKKLTDTKEFSFKSKTLLRDEIPVINNSTPIKELEVEPISSVNVIRENAFSSAANLHEMNQIVVEEFQKLADAYRVRGDKWRCMAYEKALMSLKSFPGEISELKEVASLPHISTKMLDKIADILDNGSSSKAENICNDEKTKVLNTFSKIWGAGPVTAQLWYQKGLRTLEDVRVKGNLTQSQKTGLKYYNEIQETIPREEVEEIIREVKSVAVQLEPSVQIVPCGSFRRGKQICGDVDILLIQKDYLNYRSIIPKLIREFERKGFLIDNLVGAENSLCSKYLGLCKLGHENSKIRRLDLFAVSEIHSACALIHYTGSALFNRGIRLHASRMNMHLSEYSLKANGPDGKFIFTPTEESVFEQLSLPYRRPEHRQFF